MNKDVKYEKAFIEWKEVVHNDLIKLQEQIGLHNIYQKVEDSFGKKYAQNVIDSFNKEINEEREKGRIASTIISSNSSTSTVRKNNFFGIHQ